MEQRLSSIPQLTSRIVDLRPNLFGLEREFRQFCELFVRLLNVAGNDRKRQAVEEARKKIQALGKNPPSRAEVALKFACSVVVDIVVQGWQLNVSNSEIKLFAPSFENAPPIEIKNRIRESHLFERDAQLRRTSVRDFIGALEKRRLSKNGWVSIFSLMRDGRQLADSLEIAIRQKSDERRGEILRNTISPYLQLVDGDAKCEYTGLRLIDIWRYFRHTWVSTYKSLPGRSMLFLIRDAAAENHPIIGIAALGSSMAQQTERDKWIGWDSETFVDQLESDASVTWVKWILDSVERLVNAIFIRDFLAEGIVKHNEISNPSSEAISRLLLEYNKAVNEHRRFPMAAYHKSNGTSPLPNWRKQAQTPLFRAKRARTLASLLEIRAILAKAGLERGITRSTFRKILTKRDIRIAIRQLVRFVKAEHVGIDMMDLIVCGAIPPYSNLLGGKLVCTLLTSPEVIKLYKAKYIRRVSLIASSMKGKPVIRRPNLVLISTTSLYGVGSSQYNRIRLPIKEFGVDSDEVVLYRELGVSKGYGSYHFSRDSIEYLETLLGRIGNGRKVNSIFGEGVNPLMRKIRDALSQVGLPQEELLRHGNPRVVYAVALARNFREVLLGLNSRPNYYLKSPQPRISTKMLSNYWTRRWLAKRITVPGILDEVRRHTLSYPIQHGARVVLPNDVLEELPFDLVEK